MMVDTVTPKPIPPLESAAAEQLRCYVTSALRRSGYPPLQYLDVGVRDGHVYLSARVPTLFITDHVPALKMASTDSSTEAPVEV